MVLAHDFADDTRAFAGRAIRLQTHLLHGVQNAAMHRLQPVAHIRQRPPNDDGHRVVEIRPAHFFLDVDWLNIERAGIAAFARRGRSQRKFWILIVRHREDVSFQLSVISSPAIR